MDFDTWVTSIAYRMSAEEARAAHYAWMEQQAVIDELKKDIELLKLSSMKEIGE